MESPTRIVLVSCGSFNPITNMHLRMFELARDTLTAAGHEVVGGIISAVNDAYGKKELASANHRCEMIKLALKTNNWIRLDTWETEQDTWSETLRVLQHHQDTLDSSTNANFNGPEIMKKPKLDYDTLNANYNNVSLTWDLKCPVHVRLLCGADLLESFAVPGLWKEEDIATIVGKFGLVVITRAGTNPHQFVYESDVLTKYRHNINIITEWISNEISSTRIRRAIRRGESVKYLLQDDVIQYIKTHKLFQSPDKV